MFCVLCFLISPPAWGGNKVVTVTQAVLVCLSCKLQAPPPTQICLNHSDLIPHRAYFHEGRESISEQEYSKCKIQADLASRLPRPYMGICPAQGQARTVTHIGWARRPRTDRHTKGPDSATSEQNPTSFTKANPKGVFLLTGFCFALFFFLFSLFLSYSLISILVYSFSLYF